MIKLLKMLILVALLQATPPTFALTLSTALVAAQPDTPKPSEPIRVTRSLADMGLGRQAIRMTSTQASFAFKLPLSPRELLAEAKVTLVMASSRAIIRARSELTMRVNGQVRTQQALDFATPDNKYEIKLPVELLKVGPNDISFSVVQHYTNECENTSAPDLWTEVDTLRSNVALTFSGVQPNLEPQLSRLGTVFDSRGWLTRPLSVVVGTEAVSEAQLTAAATVVQGLGLRMGHRPLSVQMHTSRTAAAPGANTTRIPGLATAVTQGHDVLLIGKRSELAQYLDSELYLVTAIGPFVGVFPAMHGNSTVIVVTGNSDDELLTAARSLAQPGFKFSDVSMETFKERDPLSSPITARPLKAESFSAFEYKTTEMRNGAQPLRFEFRTPAGFESKTGKSVLMSLHLTHTAVGRSDGSVAIRLNGQFVVNVPLSASEEGPRMVKVPAQLLKAGYNLVTFEPVVAVPRERCQPSPDEGLVLTVHDDSTLELPADEGHLDSPDLKKFADGLWPLQDNLHMFVTSRDRETLGAALTFVSALAQKNRFAFDIAMSYKATEKDHLVVFGPYDKLPTAIKATLPLKKYAWSAEGAQAGLLQVIQGERMLTLFLAHDAQVLEQALTALDSHGLWTELKGQAAVIDVAQMSVVTELGTVSRAPTVEFKGSVSTVGSVFKGDWRFFATVAIAMSAMVAFALIAALRRVVAQRRRHEREAADASSRRNPP